MNTHLEITTTAGETYYELSYLLASIISITIFLVIGIRRKYPLHDWLLIGLSGMVMMTIGVRVATFSIEDWQVFFNNGSGIYTTGKTSLGALAGFILGVGITQKILKTTYPVLDIYAFILPLVMIIQRLGCFLAGCCFGTPTETVFGIAYADHYPVSQYHFMSGLVESGSSSSLPLHPIPLYLMFWAAISLFAVYKFRQKFQRKGSLFLFSILVMSAGRWVIEFFRDPVTNHQLGEIWMGLKMVQWAILLVLTLVVTIILVRESNKIKAPGIVSSCSFSPHYWVASFIAIITVFFSGIMDTIDVLNIFIIISLYTIVLVRGIIKKKGASVVQISPLLLVFVSFFFMGQTDTLDFKMNKPERKKVSTSMTHSIALAKGKIIGEKGIYQGSGCDATRVGTLEHEAEISGGYNFESLKLYDNGDRLVLGTGFTISPFDRRRYRLDGGQYSNVRRMDWGIMGYFGKDWKGFGYRLGLWGGNLHFFSKDGSGYKLEDISVMPILQMRIGDLKGVYVKGSLADDYNYGFYRYLAKASIGGAFPIGDSYAWIELGINQNQDYNLDAEFPLTSRWLINPSIVFSEDTPIFGLGLRYRVVKD